MKGSWFMATTLISLAVSCGKNGVRQIQAGPSAADPEPPAVRVEPLQRKDFHLTVLSNGRLRASRKADLYFGSDGILRKVNVSNGSFVTEGYLLAELSRPDLELALAMAEGSLQESEIRLYDYLIGQGYMPRDTLSVPEEQLSQAKIRSGYTMAELAVRKAFVEVDRTEIRAPFSGKVTGIDKDPGDRVGQEVFCTLIDDSSFQVDFPVMETELRSVTAGAEVRITPYYDRQIVMRGKVTEVNPTVSPNGQITVRAELLSCKGLLDGMNVEVSVLESVPSQYVVPRDAVVTRDDHDVIITCSPEGRAEWKYVKILMTNGVECGIEADESRGSRFSEGDLVIISGNLNLADGTKVKVI